MTGQPALTQTAPWPAALTDLVDRVRYRPGWTVNLADIDRGQGSRGLTLIITTCGYDSCHPDRGETYQVDHYMIVPAAAYTPQSWQRWLFDQFLLVEQHEAMEFFALDNGMQNAVIRPYAPNHGHGEDPYIVHDPTTGEARRTSFRNIVDDQTGSRS